MAPTKDQTGQFTHIFETLVKWTCKKLNKELPAQRKPFVLKLDLALLICQADLEVHQEKWVHPSLPKIQLDSPEQSCSQFIGLWVSPVRKVLAEGTLWKKRGGVQIDQEDSSVFALKIEALVNANTTMDQPPPSICKNLVDGLPQNMVPTLYYNQLYKIKAKSECSKDHIPNGTLAFPATLMYLLHSLNWFANATAAPIKRCSAGVPCLGLPFAICPNKMHCKCIWSVQSSTLNLSNQHKNSNCNTFEGILNRNIESINLLV